MRIRVAGAELTLTWGRAGARTFDKAQAERALRECRQSMQRGSATVERVSRRECRAPRPTALGTVALLWAASGGLGLSPYRAMQVQTQPTLFSP